MKDAINRFAVEPSNVWPGLKYNVSVHTSVDGGETFWYCGNGRFCKNLTEVFEFVLEWTDPRYEVEKWRDRNAPNVEIVDEMPEGWFRDLCEVRRPKHAEWITALRTSERKLLYVG